MTATVVGYVLGGVAAIAVLGWSEAAQDRRYWRARATAVEAKLQDLTGVRVVEHPAAPPLRVIQGGHR